LFGAGVLALVSTEAGRGFLKSAAQTAMSLVRAAALGAAAGGLLMSIISTPKGRSIP
jgi:hypothetical protein